MNNKFDELAKTLAKSVTRRGALKKFGIGLAGVVLAALGLASRAYADKAPFRCRCGEPNYGCDPNAPSFFDCVSFCGGSTSKHACGGGPASVAVENRKSGHPCDCSVQYFGCRPDDMKCIKNCAYRCS